jgi:hypothetical protein
LTDADVADLAFRVKGGDTPRVVVRSGSAAVPAGTRGNVIRIGKPAEGEYIVVRLGRDEVPFAPNELGLSTRGRPTAAASSKAAAAAKSPARSPAKSAPARASKATKPAAAAKPAKTAAKTAAAAAASPAAGRSTASAPSRGRRAVGRTRAGSRRGPQPLTVTLRFTDGGWSVEAQRGSRRLARATALRPGAVKAFAELVDDTAVRDAMTETVESCRAVVEERAEKLRAELEAAEAALREYEARRR